MNAAHGPAAAHLHQLIDESLADYLQQLTTWARRPATHNAPTSQLVIAAAHFHAHVDDGDLPPRTAAMIPRAIGRLNTILARRGFDDLGRPIRSRTPARTPATDHDRPLF